MEARNVVNPARDVPERRIVAKVHREGRIRKNNSHARLARSHLTMQTHVRSPWFQKPDQRALSPESARYLLEARRPFIA
jgi:hypothetical protein